MNRTPVGARTASGWVLGRVGGVPVVLAPSWLLITAVLFFVYYQSFAGMPHLARAGWFVPVGIAIGFVVALFVAVFVHEIAHGLTGQALGQRPREYVLTFWGGHTAFTRSDIGPGAWALICLAGPLANVALAGLSWLGAYVPEATTLPMSVFTTIMWGSLLGNGLLAAFNLLPGLPLDGGGALQALVWKVTGDRARGTVVAAWAGRVIVVAGVAWVLLVPYLRGARPNLSTAIWALLIGSFLWMGAGQALRTARMEQAARWVDLRALVVPTLVLDERVSLAQVGEQLAGGAAVVVLVDAGRPTGLVEPAALAEVPPHLHAGTPASAVARSLDPAQILAPLTGTEALAAVARAQHHGPLVVLHDGAHVLGAVPVAAVAKVVNT